MNNPTHGNRRNYLHNRLENKINHLKNKQNEIN